MSPFAVQVLRRVALLAGLTAVLLLGVPWALTWAGLLGPGPQEDIESAERSLAAARSYGAEAGEASFRAGSAELARSRELLAAGRTREARRAAARARALGIEAQRAALGARESGRRRAEAIVREIDSELSRLERLYEERGPAQPEQARLLSLMKEARLAGGKVFLAFDQGQFGRVAELEATAREKLLLVEDQLQASARRPPPP